MFGSPALVGAGLGAVVSPARWVLVTSRDSDGVADGFISSPGAGTSHYTRDAFTNTASSKHPGPAKCTRSPGWIRRAPRFRVSQLQPPNWGGAWLGPVGQSARSEMGGPRPLAANPSVPGDGEASSVCHASAWLWEAN